MNVNVPNIYYVTVPRLGLHMARSMIAGCKTECGIDLMPGWQWRRTALYEVCTECERVYSKLQGVGRLGLALEVRDQEVEELMTLVARWFIDSDDLARAKLRRLAHEHREYR